MAEGIPINPEEYAHEKGDFTDVHTEEFKNELSEGRNLTPENELSEEQYKERLAEIEKHYYYFEDHGSVSWTEAEESKQDQLLKQEIIDSYKSDLLFLLSNKNRLSEQFDNREIKFWDGGTWNDLWHYYTGNLLSDYHDNPNQEPIDFLMDHADILESIPNAYFEVATKKLKLNPENPNDQLIGECLDVLEKTAISPNYWTKKVINEEFIPHIVLNANDEDFSRCIELLSRDDFFQSESLLRTVSTIMSKCYDYHTKEFHQEESMASRATDVMRKVFKLEPEKIIQYLPSWVKGRENDVPGDFFKNLEVFTEIERKNPGSTSILTSEFGIRQFAGLSAEMLTDQYEKINDTERPYGIVIRASDELTGSSGLQQFHESLGDKYNLRVIETDSQFSLVRHLLKLNHKYGQHHRISFAVIHGHGADYIIHLGPDWGPGKQITKKDLTKPEVNKIKGFFVEHPRIVLASCSTAQGPTNIAQIMSRELGARVTGPNCDDNVLEMKAIFGDDNDFDIYTKFRWGGDKAAVTYDNGEKI